MKEKKKFSIGSSVFFKGYFDFLSKDNDSLYIMTDWNIKPTTLNFKKDDKDCFFIMDSPKDVIIQDTLEKNVPMKAGKFLVPEFAEYIGLTIDDLKLLQPLFDKMDEKHSYEKIIYDSYVANDAFILTDELRKKAYEEYKKTRNEE